MKHVTPPELPVDAASALEKPLRKILKVWRRGLFAAWAWKALGIVLLAVAVYGLADFLLALPSWVRLFAGVALLAILAGSLVWKLRQLGRLNLGDAAACADRVREDPRRTLLSGWELHSVKVVNHGAFNPSLSRAVLREAGQRLKEFPPKHCFPGVEVREALRRSSWFLVPALLIMVLNFSATLHIAGRIFLPLADIPPYSPLEFKVVPDQPEAIYGEGLELAVEISGGEVDDPVYLISRIPGGEVRKDCFRGSNGRFSQRLENVLTPVEFCFQTGKARSRWHQAELRIEPRFSLAKLRIEAPAYSGIAPREFVVGNEEFKALAGSRATLTVASNRPLAGGTAAFRPAGQDEPSATYEAKNEGMHTLSFSWLMTRNGTVSVELVDVVGSKSPDPLELVQTAFPDEKPTVALHQPPAYSLATPSTVLAVAASASDDIALRRVNFVRTVAGFRDRARHEGPAEPQKDLEIHDDLDLETLGVLPGQVLELYVEALDQNPALTGSQTSDIARVEIIPEEEYAQILRDQTEIEEFLGRYRLMEEKWEALRKSLEEALEAARRSDHEATDQKLQKVREAAKEGGELFSQLARDFPAFDHEESLRAVMQKVSGTVGEISETLQGMNSRSGNIQEALQASLEKMGGQQGEIDQNLADAEEIAKVGQAMRLASRFMELISRQENLVRRLERLEGEIQPDAALAGSLGERQEEIREELNEVSQALVKAAEEISGLEGEGYERFINDINEFNKALEASQAGAFMDRASGALENSDVTKGSSSAQIALERLRSLLSQSGNCMAGLCRGQLQFKLPSALRPTLAQILASLMGQGQGTGQGGVGGSGIGIGGTGDTGGSQSGYSVRSLPVFGPDRMRLMSTGGGASDGKARMTGQGQEMESESAELDFTERKENLRKSEATNMDRAPEKYRGAVRRFFDLPESNL